MILLQPGEMAVPLPTRSLFEHNICNYTQKPQKRKKIYDLKESLHLGGTQSPTGPSSSCLTLPPGFTQFACSPSPFPSVSWLLWPSL
ncbi:hypothetical protein XELAEV_18000855mg [Xenopus laevis]|nr:hypothetical protein XELAEV_18000855mg [Xenopus laevis]